MERIKVTNCHVFLRMVGEVEKPHEWFGSILIVAPNISKVFAETITQPTAHLADVYFFA